MTDYILLFKKYLAMYASATGLREGEIRRERGINDFLIDAAEKRWEPKEFACRFLSQCCRRDGGYTDQVLCLVAVDFLRDALAKPPSADDKVRRQQIKDCLDVVTNPGTYEAIGKWADSWF